MLAKTGAGKPFWNPVYFAELSPLFTAHLDCYKILLDFD
jgi:hypothetical protein